MSDPLRTAPADAPVTEADREALVERLLIAGLDHYFEGRYEQAVNVWTRVAFLERGHGRARAYIERARGALAERQRQSDELLHQGIEAYDAGDLPAARELLTRAAADGGANETALVFLQRLGQVEVGASAAALGPLGARMDRASRAVRRPAPAAPPEARTNWFTTVVASAVVAAAILFAAQPIASWLGERPIGAPSIDPQPAEPLPIVRASEARMARARVLYDAGRLRDALRLADAIDVGDPLRAEADRFRADIQRDLLATAGSGSPAAEASR